MSDVRDRLALIHEKLTYLKDLAEASRELRADINTRYPETAGNIDAVRCPHMRKVFAALQKIDDWNAQHQATLS